MKETQGIFPCDRPSSTLRGWPEARRCVCTFFSALSSFLTTLWDCWHRPPQSPFCSRWFCVLLRFETQATCGIQCYCVCGLKNQSTSLKKRKETLLPAIADSHPKGGPASFRPSELYTKHKGTFETTELLTPKRHQLFTPRQNLKGKRIPTSPLSQ